MAGAIDIPVVLKDHISINSRRQNSICQNNNFVLRNYGVVQSDKLKTVNNTVKSLMMIKIYLNKNS